MQKRVSENVITVESLGKLERNVESYMITLPKAVVMNVQVLRNPMLIRLKL